MRLQAGAVKEVQALPRVIRTSGSPVQQRAIQALGEIGDPRAVPALVDASTHADVAVRQAATAALERITEQSESDANEGATATVADIMGKGALLVYAAPSPGIRVPSAGYTFSWKQYAAGAKGIRIKRYRIERLASERIEGEMTFDQKVVGADLGLFMDDAVA